MEQNKIVFYLVMIAIILIVTAISLLATRKKKKKHICKYDGHNLKDSGTGSLYCPKCSKIFYVTNGKLMEKY